MAILITMISMRIGIIMRIYEDDCYEYLNMMRKTKTLMTMMMLMLTMMMLTTTMTTALLFVLAC